MFEWYAESLREFRRGRHGGPWGHAHGGGFGAGFGPTERGGLKYEILSVLWDGPRHGYEIMLAIEERRGYRPSPGSIYPALQLLEDEDCVTGREVDGKRVYTISAKGSELLQKYRESPEGARGAAGDAPRGMEIMARGVRAVHGLKEVAKQIARSGNLDAMERAIEIVERTRRELYTILADGV